MGRIRTETWRTLWHVTGPSALFVGLLFGAAPEGGPRILPIVRANQTDGTIKFDLGRHVEEVLAGVSAANEEFGGSLSVEAIMVVTDDYPSPWQSKFVAYLIAKQAITGVNWPTEPEPAPPE